MTCAAAATTPWSRVKITRSRPWPSVRGGGGLAAARRRVPAGEKMVGAFGKWVGARFRNGCCGSTQQIDTFGTV